jgi:hypothetical protein
MTSSQIEILQGFHSYVSRELPDGLAGIENAFLVTIGGNELNVVLFGISEDANVAFGLFVVGAKPTCRAGTAWYRR